MIGSQRCGARTKSNWVAADPGLFAKEYPLETKQDEGGSGGLLLKVTHVHHKKLRYSGRLGREWVFLEEGGTLEGWMREFYTAISCRLGCSGS